jgi:hypothetical protein
MDSKSCYVTHFESQLEGRYITLQDLFPLLDSYKNGIEISISGISQLGQEIPLLKMGTGKKVVLGWSQMHGNETTTTKAVFDFLKFISQKDSFQKEIKLFLETYTLFLIPILNPDGADAYTRENANSIDLNRDAKQLSQNESKILHEIFQKVKPELCLNLHDQRSIYGFESGMPATISFLAPAANEDRSLTPSRKIGMEHIVRINDMLQKIIPGQVGRYDDSFNENCVGDTFQMKGVPTILFEAGHTANDYQREKTRELIFYCFLELFGITGRNKATVNYNDYFSIPENKSNFKDIILRNVQIGSNNALSDIAIQFSEVLQSKTIHFEAFIDSIGTCDSFYGHREVDVLGERILINSQEKIEVGKKISIIVIKSDESLIIFPKKQPFII